MPILIAHRGNVNGPQPEKENTLAYLFAAIEAGYDVEVDVWNVNGLWLLGHDGPHILVHENDLHYLETHAWFHAKNYSAFYELDQLGCNVFAHEDDPFVSTSKGWIWSHKGCENPHGIVVMPSLETEKHLILNCAGVCHDYLLDVEEILADNPHNV
jgi:hypothetical protein